jgi:hypothetical protein
LVNAQVTRCPKKQKSAPQSTERQPEECITCNRTANCLSQNSYFPPPHSSNGLAPNGSFPQLKKAAAQKTTHRIAFSGNSEGEYWVYSMLIYIRSIKCMFRNLSHEYFGYYWALTVRNGWCLSGPGRYHTNRGS